MDETMHQHLPQKIVKIVGEQNAKWTALQMKVANVAQSARNKYEQYEPTINYLDNQGQILNITNKF